MEFLKESDSLGIIIDRVGYCFLYTGKLILNIACKRTASHPIRFPHSKAGCALLSCRLPSERPHLSRMDWSTEWERGEKIWVSCMPNVLVGKELLLKHMKESRVYLKTFENAFDCEWGWGYAPGIWGEEGEAKHRFVGEDSAIASVIDLGPGSCQLISYF